MIANRQTHVDRQTDTLSTILRFHIESGVIKKMGLGQDGKKAASTPGIWSEQCNICASYALHSCFDVDVVVVLLIHRLNEFSLADGHGSTLHNPTYKKQIGKCLNLCRSYFDSSHGNPYGY